MNFIEAVNSGQEFGFVDIPGWYLASEYSEYGSCEDFFDILVDHGLDAAQEIINGKFKLKENPISITEEKFDSICDKHNADLDIYGKVSVVWLKEVKRDMGF